MFFCSAGQALPYSEGLAAHSIDAGSCGQLPPTLTQASEGCPIVLGYLYPQVGHSVKIDDLRGREALPDPDAHRLAPGASSPGRHRVGLAYTLRAVSHRREAGIPRWEAGKCFSLFPNSQGAKLLQKQGSVHERITAESGVLTFRRRKEADSTRASFIRVARLACIAVLALPGRPLFGAQDSLQPAQRAVCGALAVDIATLAAYHNPPGLPFPGKFRKPQGDQGQLERAHKNIGC